MGIEKRNILDYGNAGTMKTMATVTLLKEEQLRRTPDIQLFYLCAEANSLAGIRAGLDYHKIKLKENQLHYMVTKALTPSSFADRAKHFQNNFIEKDSSDVQKVKATPKGKKVYNSFMATLEGLANYVGTDIYTGKTTDFGDLMEWKSNRILITDSLSAISEALVSSIMGERQTMIISDYSDFQNQLFGKILIPLTDIVEFSFILLGHPDLIEDPNVQQPTNDQRLKGMLPSYIMAPRTAGNKSSHRIASKFTEVMYSYEDGDNFFWATKHKKAVVRCNSLPREAKLVKDYSKYEKLFIPSL